MVKKKRSFKLIYWLGQIIMAIPVFLVIKEIIPFNLGILLFTPSFLILLYYNYETKWKHKFIQLEAYKRLKTKYISSQLFMLIPILLMYMEKVSFGFALFLFAICIAIGIYGDYKLNYLSNLYKYRDVKEILDEK